MAKPKFVTPVIHVGQDDYTQEAEYFTPDYEYYQSDDDALDQEILEGQPLFKANGKLNGKYRNAVFILDAGFPWFLNDRVMEQLPANQILMQSNLNLSETTRSLLKLKGAFEFNPHDPQRLIGDIQRFFYYDPDGYRFSPQAWHYNWDQIQSVSQRGNVYHQINLKPTDDWQLIMSPMDSFYLPLKMANKVALEYHLGPENELALKLIQIDADTKEVLRSSFISGNELQTSIDVIGTERPTFFQVLLYARGKGQLEVGNLHVRRARGPYGEMMPNDWVISDQKQHGSTGVYFDAGDMKPPLNVYFAGYRTKEGYEGRRMMQNFGAPFLLISDWRLEGGAFYMGDTEFEQQIVNIIKQTLQKLNFKDSDLILSGMSMGTFGAMYYGSRLNPAGIVLGKPLAELGTIAQNGRVKRPNDFRTGEDMQLYYEPDLSDQSSHDLDQRYWHNLEQGELSNTTLAIAYMLQDDYNKDAYQGIRDRFIGLNPNGKLLAKGFEGRHNDQTGPIVEWFQRQYWYLLSQFGRKQPRKPQTTNLKKKQRRGS
ncbi:accessory Sec system protein Asp2 [Fructilactobacillus carniphilus]|uniref:Accessory Sec system protein Asp2 n=1 Tax=Fructilactobacillus carniphilus TaxID=2940297 RepID=A0ABY5BU42_9LACO|nr:accessory Sec system protein Asp2 [Fructilactobacillus carniphilus]USS90020.1 accessory Sec system protein Asp2 [Fructilactobacillus carniphilus]